MMRPLLGPDFQSTDGAFPVPLTERGRAARREVLAMMQSGAYVTEAAPCLCGSAREELICSVDRYRLPHRTVMCADCGLVRTNPRWNVRAYEDFYARFYRAIYERPGDTADGMFARQRTNAERRAGFITRHIRAGRPLTVLEIGCGGGWNLLPLRERGHSVSGYDFDEDYLAAGRAQGLDLRRGGLEAAIVDGRRRDLVVLSHVVEHLLDPVGELARLRPVIGQGGHLFVEVPNLFGVTRNLLRYWQGAHTYSFVPATLRALMSAAGYEEVAFDDAIASLWRVRVGPTGLVAWPRVAAETRRFLASRNSDFLPKLMVRALARRLRRRFGAG